MGVVRVVTVVRAPAERLFDLALDMGVHSESLARSGETATTSNGSPVLGLGDEVAFTARHLGRTWRMTSRVTELARSGWFVDEQVTGPFAGMRHEHRFDPTGAGATTMTDVMTVRLPLGPLGRLAGRLLVEPYLRRLLRERADHLRRRAEGAG